MASRIYLREGEHVALIKATTDMRKPISTGFGGGRVWLNVDDDGRVESDWALPIIARMRGIVFDDGAGI